MPKSSTVIAENAVRLLEDAKHLQGHSSHRTATSLAILAIEEAGKACYVRWLEDGLIPHTDFHPRLTHRDKQSLLLAFFFFQSALKALEVYYEDHTKHPSFDGIDLAALSAKEAARTIWRAHVNSANDDLSDFVVEYCCKNGGKHMFYADMLVFDYVKQAGFYEDVGTAGEILCPFGTPDADNAQQAIELAEAAVKVPYRSLWCQRVMLGIYRAVPRTDERKARQALTKAIAREGANLAKAAS